jgi:flagellar biogenesis protein FliO
MTPLTRYVVETLVTLFAVVALAVLVLVAARRVGVGRGTGPLELVGRLPLDGRRSVYLVRVAETVYVVGASEAGLHKLGELSGDSVKLPAIDADAAARPSTSFKEALERALGKKS